MPPSETDNVTASAPALPLQAATAIDEKLPSTNPPMQPNDNNNCPIINQQCASTSSNDINGSINNNGVVEKDGEATPQADDPAAQTDEKIHDSLLVVQQDALHSTNNSSNNTPNNAEKNNNIDSTPLSTSFSSSPRRRIIKKRRSDDFVYTDTKKQDKPPPPPNNNTEQQSNNGTTTNHKSPPPLQSTKNNNNHKPKQQQQPRKRPHQCPTTDSILIDVPLSVTADLGVALKRTRRKRIKRIQDWVASSSSVDDGVITNNNNNKTVVKKSSESTNKKEYAKDDSCSDSNSDEDDDNDDEKDITLDYYNDDEDALMGKTPKRNHYGSVLDYLEAKYVRGVMIADYDDREQAKQMKLQQQQQQQQRNNNKEEEEEEEVDSEGDNSCYDDDDGFIDDSLMVEDVAGQVMASSTYGLTQIEEEARRRKEERESNKRESGSGIVEELGITEEKLDDTRLEDEEGMESGFDDGFFVNLGDLEMAEGWSGENVVISPTKKNKKRAKKRVNKAAATTASKDDVAATKKKKKTSLLPSSSSPKKKKKSSDDTTKQKTTDSNSKKAAATSQKKGKKTPSSSSSGKSEDKQPKKKDQAVKHPTKKVVSPEKERATQLRKVMKRKYNACIKMIKDMTSDQLPLKQRNKKTVKLSVSIPADKNIGDEITFANPNIPGQKLKVQIPAKADMEKRTFVASVPGPKVPFTKKENNLPKEFKEALCDYSTAYDDWCTAEEAHNASLPENKRKDYKLTTEKMKKFDEMITEFPKRLATPIDATYLRAAVRRVRSNKARQEKRKSSGSAASETLKQRQTVTEKVVVNISVPQKGSEFELVSFNRQDFQE